MPSNSMFVVSKRLVVPEGEKGETEPAGGLSRPPGLHHSRVLDRGLDGRRDAPGGPRAPARILA